MTLNPIQIRKLILPYADLNLEGASQDYLELGRDISLALVYAALQSDQGARLQQGDRSGNQLVRDAGGANYNTGQATIGTSSGIIIAANPNRLALIITNLGGAVVYLGQATVVLPTTGWGLVANGSLNVTSTAAFYGISSSTGNVVTYMELVP